MKPAFGAAESPEPGRAYPAPWTASPGVQVAVPIDDRLRLVVSWLGDGDVLERSAGGEDALYVLAGAVDLDGRRVPAGGAVVLHADTPCRLTAVGDTHLAQLSPSSVLGVPGHGERGPVHPEREGGGAHLIGPGGIARSSGSGGASQATWFADSTCDGCDVALFRVERDTPGNRGRAHTHSADEILFVLEGSIRLGAHEVPTHHAVLVPRGVRYAVTCGPTKHAFLNYRPTASSQHYEGDAEPVPETPLERGGELVGDVIA